jgi:hypothetical protein
MLRMMEERPLLERELTRGSFLETDLKGGSFLERQIGGRCLHRMVEEGSF